jgi:hypothetical protein
MNNIKDWISKIIDSCTDDFQFEAVDKLIELHYERFKNEAEKIELSLQRANKWNAIHYIISPIQNK